MSVIVRVRQFFNEEGLRAFPRLFEEHRRRAAAFPGFISLSHPAPVKGASGGEQEMTLEFADDALLQSWRSSPEHAQVAAAYRPFWVREPEVTFSRYD